MVCRIAASTTGRYGEQIDDALGFLRVVDDIDNLDDPQERARQLDRIGDDILERNNRVLLTGVTNQAFPFNRQAAGRWFDELAWPPSVLDSLDV